MALTSQHRHIAIPRRTLPLRCNFTPGLTLPSKKSSSPFSPHALALIHSALHLAFRSDMPSGTPMLKPLSPKTSPKSNTETSSDQTPKSEVPLSRRLMTLGARFPPALATTQTDLLLYVPTASLQVTTSILHLHHTNHLPPHPPTGGS